MQTSLGPHHASAVKRCKAIGVLQGLPPQQLTAVLRQQAMLTSMPASCTAPRAMRQDLQAALLLMSRRRSLQAHLRYSLQPLQQSSLRRLRKHLPRLRSALQHRRLLLQKANVLLHWQQRQQTMRVSQQEAMQQPFMQSMPRLQRQPRLRPPHPQQHRQTLRPHMQQQQWQQQRRLQQRQQQRRLQQ